MEHLHNRFRNIGIWSSFLYKPVPETDSFDLDVEETAPFLAPKNGSNTIASRFYEALLLLTRKTIYLILSLLRKLSPSFTHHLWRTPPSSALSPPPTGVPHGRSGQRSNIQYLDGIRGIACLIVFNFHFCYPYTPTIFFGYGADVGDTQHRFLHQLPFICLLYRGRAMVVLFFVLSGYVLSYRYLAKIRNQSWKESQQSLSSLVVRRWARLFFPSTVSMSIVMFAAYLGAFEAGRLFQESEWKTGTWEQHPVQLPKFMDQVDDFRRMWWDWSSPWNWNLYFSNYDPHTWTIPLEFRASMILFIVLVSRTRLRPLHGILLTCVVIIYCTMCGRWDAAVFLAGSLVAEAHVVFSPQTETEGLARLPEKSKRRVYTKIITRLVALVCLYILSFPDAGPEVTPGFATMALWTPSTYGDKHYFWQYIACPPLLWCIGVDKPLRWLFETNVAQYFGKISFALYLTHGPLLHSLGFAMQPVIWQIFGHETTFQWCLGLFLGWIIMFGLSIWVGDIFCRWVDLVLVSYVRRWEKLISV